MAKKKRETVGEEPWLIHYFQRHSADDRTRTAPAREFLESCPTEVKAHLSAVLTAVSEAPPPRFSGGLQWHAMHDEMKSYFEARDRHGPWLCRLFCVLERNGAEVGLGGPSIVLITGIRKPNESASTRAAYAKVRSLALSIGVGRLEAFFAEATKGRLAGSPDSSRPVRRAPRRRCGPARR